MNLVSVRLTANLESVLALMDLQEERIREPMPLLRKVANVLRADARRAFTESGPGWEPTADSTNRQKERRGQSAATILIAAGRLRDAWGVKSSSDHKEDIDPAAMIVDVGPDESKIPYAARHQGNGEISGSRALKVARSAGKISGKSLKERVTGEKQSPRAAIGAPVRPVTLSQAAETRIRELARAFYTGEPEGSLPA